MWLDFSASGRFFGRFGTKYPLKSTLDSVPLSGRNRPSPYEAVFIPIRLTAVLDECEDTAKSQSFRFSLDDGEEVELVNRLGVLPLLIRAKRTLEWSLGTV